MPRKIALVLTLLFSTACAPAASAPASSGGMAQYQWLSGGLLNSRPEGDMRPLAATPVLRFGESTLDLTAACSDPLVTLSNGESFRPGGSTALLLAKGLTAKTAC